MTSNAVQRLEIATFVSLTDSLRPRSAQLPREIRLIFRYSPPPADELGCRFASNDKTELTRFEGVYSPAFCGPMI
jgi:hypothetical protein